VETNGVRCKLIDGWDHVVKGRDNAILLLHVRKGRATRNEHLQHLHMKERWKGWIGLAP